uniref:Peptidase C1A papain C-terminal domain-containing protein n=1 Tax=Panagrolaimus sp. ES5 TaxID=591445 RepID=A0AC34GN08_9BILA
MSAEERKKYLGANKPNPVSKKIHQNPHDAILSPLIPTSYDFRSVRKVSPVKNQGGCGSCWAFASVAAVESQYLIRQNKTLDLSEQTLVSCDRDQNGGGSSGWMNLAYNYIQTKGIPTETCNPYETADGICTKACNNQRYFIDSYICFGDDESKFAKDLYNFGPASMSFAVPEAMFFYESGILDIPADQCLNENIGWHAAVIVGYTPEYWIAKNSWGKDWGERG